MGFIFDTDSITPDSGSGGGGGSAVINPLSVIPSTSSQTITASSGVDGYSPINVAAVTSNIDNNIVAENIKDGVTILNVTGNYTGSGSGEYQLTRVLDDNGNEIGTAFMEFTDANGNRFKVVCLDAQYRNSSAQWCSNKSIVTDMPVYKTNNNTWWYDNAKETATENTQLILDYCSASSYTSEACTHCRSQSFTINGTTYYGQLPNMIEVFDLWHHRTQLEQMDTSASSNPSTNFRTYRQLWSSSQYSGDYSWYLSNDGSVDYSGKTYKYFVCPILEIPLS